LRAGISTGFALQSLRELLGLHHDERVVHEQQRLRRNRGAIPAVD
jgi:hypothetical protein